MEEYYTIGLMSGTSLDGLDIAYCKFTREKNVWSFQLLNSTTVEYDKTLVGKLQNCIHFEKEELDQFDLELGAFFGVQTKAFIDENDISPLLVASHGHTVFHQPEKGYTLQIGDGKSLKNNVQTEVINDFRSLDVKLGGQGAPLVPIGDKLLFSEFDYCLNLGGIANVSYDENNIRKAFDVCSCNLVLNHLSEELGLKYDDKGNIAKSGNFIKELYTKLLNNPYYSKKGSKSLGKEDVWDFDINVVNKYNCSVEDKLRTFVELIAIQISNSIEKGRLLITGGGAYNEFLIQRIGELNPDISIKIPDRKIIEFKEALIFSFLGLLKHLGEVNVLSSVTGASKNSCSGVIVN